LKGLRTPLSFGDGLERGEHLTVTILVAVHDTIKLNASVF